MLFKSWLTNSRFYILTGSCLLALAIYVGVSLLVPSINLQIVRLDELYGLLSLAFLYVSLLPTPLYLAFPALPHKIAVIKARRALGVSAFLFGALHTYIAFFDQLKGFSGIAFYGNKYHLAIVVGAIGLAILALLAVTSFDLVVKKLGSAWKILHRFVYLAGVLIIVHVLLLGTHYSDLPNSLIAQISFMGLAVLLLLEAKRFDSFLASRYNFKITLGLATVLVFVLAWDGLQHFIHIPFGLSGGSLSLHAQHEQTLPAESSVLTFNPGSVQAGKPTDLIFQDSSGQGSDTVLDVTIVAKDFQYSANAQIEYMAGGFKLTTVFPRSGSYQIFTQVLSANKPIIDTFTLTVT
jgi:DMSO/TMAO reductase YedYZ heme-binding membrane subunit